MKNKTLSLLALLGAPTMTLGVLAEYHIPALGNSWFTGLWGITYITTWIAGIVCMQRLKATGTSTLGKALLWILIGTLTIADISNLFWIIYPAGKPEAFFYLDLFWPLSHLLMLPIGIMVTLAKGLPGWYRYIPLVQGFWLPVALGSKIAWGEVEGSLYLGCVYSLVVWSIMNLILYRQSEKSGHDTSPILQTA
ncbi:hypothetical protein [Telluribacter sp. SYSU D00476]|uniref:hypothetical protein n=1 Tax=Telluribacter sp. SYSU D00476 TaxID=2811430 RepID=UPI001FF5748F|nr:hypothetical protein [Telluribacter sp. SYSU D00476]